MNIISEKCSLIKSELNVRWDFFIPFEFFISPLPAPQRDDKKFLTRVSHSPSIYLCPLMCILLSKNHTHFLARIIKFVYKLICVSV